MMVIFDSECMNKSSRDLLGLIESRLDMINVNHVRTVNEDEITVDSITRCKRANEISKRGKSILISLLIEEGDNTFVFISSTANSNSKRLASFISTEANMLNRKVKGLDYQHGYWKTNHTILTKTSMPAILVKSRDMGKDEILADIIIKGICDYYEISYTI